MPDGSEAQLKLSDDRHRLQLKQMKLPRPKGRSFPVGISVNYIKPPLTPPLKGGGCGEHSGQGGEFHGSNYH